MSSNPVLKPGALIGAVDAGSNAIRFSVFKLDSRLYPLRVYQQRYPVRLGAGTFTDGALAPSGMGVAVEAFLDIAATCRDREVSAIQAVATSAIREASNSEYFLQKISQETGVQLRVITGEEEARLAALGVTRSVPSGNKHLIFDVGGGSSETIHVAPDGEIIWAQSLPLGAVRLSQEWKNSGWPQNFQEYTSRVSQLQRSLPAALLQRAAELDPATDAIAIGGTAYAVSRVCEKLGVTCQENNLNLSELASATRLMSETPIENYPDRLGVDAERSQILLPGAAILGQLLQLFQQETATISDAGIREGLAYEILAADG